MEPYLWWTSAVKTWAMTESAARRRGQAGAPDWTNDLDSGEDRRRLKAMGVLRARASGQQRDLPLVDDRVIPASLRADAQPYLGARTRVRRQDDRSGIVPAAELCGRSVFRGRPGRRALAAGSIREPTAKPSS